jgi:CrcB protein
LINKFRWQISEILFYGVPLTNIILVGFGGFIGSVLRYLASGYVQQSTKSIDFPYGTLAVNVFGCFVIGFLAQLAEERGVFTSGSRSFVFVGILGGFTTFSSFGNETLNLARDSQMMNAFANVGANVILGLFAVWLGRTVSYLIWK